MNKLAVATAALFAAVATSSAYAGMSMQGPQLTGVSLQSLASDRQVVTGVRLASGETIGLRKARGASGR